MKTTPISVALILTVLIPWFTQAAEAQASSMPPLVGALDANRDRTISAEEITNAPTSLKTLDKNGDGQLTGDEALPAKALKASKRPPLLAALDTNGNGVINADEIKNAPAALRALDKNGDGQLGRADLNEVKQCNPERRKRARESLKKNHNL